MIVLRSRDRTDFTFEMSNQLPLWVEVRASWPRPPGPTRRSRAVAECRLESIAPRMFRRPEHTPLVAAEAVAIHAKTLWLQSGISNQKAAELASAGGLEVVMDSCIGVMVSLLGIPRRA